MKYFVNKKNGRTYRVLDLRVTNATNAQVNDDMVLYQSPDGEFYVRERSEFNLKFREFVQGEDMNFENVGSVEEKNDYDNITNVIK